MARKTLLQSWNELINRIKEIEKEKLKSFFSQNSQPSKVYYCSHLGDISECDVIGFVPRFININRPSIYSNSKPTRLQVEELERYVESIETEDYKIHVLYTTDLGTGNLEYDKFTDNWAFHPSELEEKARENKEKYAPREGYSPCQHCGRQVPTENLIKAKIIGRGCRQVWNSWKRQYENKACITEAYLSFCSNQCAAHEQMSREG
jgi:hypothetical protein